MTGDEENATTRDPRGVLRGALVARGSASLGFSSSKWAFERFERGVWGGWRVSAFRGDAGSVDPGPAFCFRFFGLLAAFLEPDFLSSESKGTLALGVSAVCLVERRAERRGDMVVDLGNEDEKASRRGLDMMSMTQRCCARHRCEHTCNPKFTTKRQTGDLGNTIH